MNPVIPRHLSHTSVLTLVAFLACDPASSSAATRTFKDTSGRSIEAEVVSVSGDAVTLRRSDGRVFLHPLAIFAPEDQAYIKNGGREVKRTDASAPVPGKVEKKEKEDAPPAVVEPKSASASGQPYLLEPRIRIGKSDRLSKIEKFDDRALRLSVGVDITNRHPTRELHGGKGTLIIMGRSVLQLREYAVLGREEFPVDVPVKTPFRFEGKDIASEYDDKGGTSRFGYTYSGYVFVLQDAEGRIILAAASPGGNARFAEKVLTLQPKTYVDRDFEPLKGRPATTIRLR